MNTLFFFCVRGSNLAYIIHCLLPIEQNSRGLMNTLYYENQKVNFFLYFNNSNCIQILIYKQERLNKMIHISFNLTKVLSSNPTLSKHYR